MNLMTCDSTELQPLAVQFREDGMVVIRSLELPDTFDPPETDAVFLRSSEGGCEVHIGINTCYQGTSPIWHEIDSRQEEDGRARLAASVPGDFLTGVNALRDLLLEAGGEFDASDDDQSALGHPALFNEHSASLMEPNHEPPSPRRRRRQPGALVLRDLVEAARQNPKHFVGRAKELREMKASLIRESKPGVVLVGPAGCGKTTLVEMLAQDISVGRVPERLREVALYDLPLGSLLENARYVGDLERQVRDLLERPDKPIFFADEIHQLARQELRPIADLLKPALASGSVRMIGATTPTEWRQVQDRAFRRRFVQIDVAEPSPKETFAMIQPRLRTISDHHSISFDELAVREATMLVHRYLPGKTFPDKAIDLLDLAAASQVEAASEMTTQRFNERTQP